MQRSQRRHRIADAALAFLAVGVAYAAEPPGEAYPTRPVRVVTSEIGGSADAGARLMAHGLTSRLGKQVIVDNRGSGIIPGDIVARAAPDGHTLLFFGGTFWLQPLLRKNVPYDPVRDFAPITMAVLSPSVLVVHPSVQAATVKELIALSKSKPGELNYAMGSPGSTNHLAAEMFKVMAGVNIVGIGYKGTGPAVNGLITNQVQMMFATASAVMPLVKSGRLRALAVGSQQPSSVVPDLPTIAASGLPGYESVSATALFAPAKTPQPIIRRLHAESVSYLRSAEARERFLVYGAEPVGSTPEELGARVKSELARVARVIKEAGIRAE
jgi:tripartite-type tricarboxylate transporter receptor subunit TctC